MDEKQRQAAFISALTTEHTVLQAASNATFTDAAARSSLYVFSLSSSLVALGFAANSSEIFLPFVAAILPALFVLGVFTIMRLIDSTIENMRYLDGMARIRSYYRTLTPEAAELFAAAHGRWPETGTEPSQALGALVAFLTTTASMVAFINSLVAAAGVTLLAYNVVAPGRTRVALALGAAAAVALMALFVVFQRWRFSTVQLSVEPGRTGERTSR